MVPPGADSSQKSGLGCRSFCQSTLPVHPRRILTKSTPNELVDEQSHNGEHAIPSPAGPPFARGPAGARAKAEGDATDQAAPSDLGALVHGLPVPDDDDVVPEARRPGNNAVCAEAAEADGAEAESRKPSTSRSPTGGGDASPTKRPRPLLWALRRIACVSSRFEGDFSVAFKYKKQHKGRELDVHKLPPQFALSDCNTWLTHGAIGLNVARTWA